MRYVVLITLLFFGCGGDDGDSGSSGVSVENHWICKDSQDIDNTDKSRYGFKTEVIGYSDGSYMIMCLVSGIRNENTEDEIPDASTGFRFYKADTEQVTKDRVINCLAYHVAARFNLDTQKVDYINLGDETQKETVACEKQ